MSPYSEDDPLKHAINTLNCLGYGTASVIREDHSVYYLVLRRGWKTDAMSANELIAYAARLHRLKAFL